MVLGFSRCIWSFLGSGGFLIGTAQQKPRVSRNHMCHETNYLLSPVPFQFHFLLRVLSTVAKSLELHWAHF